MYAFGHLLPHLSICKKNTRPLEPPSSDSNAAATIDLRYAPPWNLISSFFFVYRRHILHCRWRRLGQRQTYKALNLSFHRRHRRVTCILEKQTPNCHHDIIRWGRVRCNSSCTKEVSWLPKLSWEIRHEKLWTHISLSATPVFVDITAAKAMTIKAGNIRSTKHIDIKAHHVM